MCFRRVLAEYASDVDEALVHLFRDLTAQVAPLHAGVLEITEAIRVFTCGPGKRLRPVLMRVAYEGLGGTDTQAIVQTSCAVELLQSFLLIHDDIMDHAELRRGRPSLHRWYRARYQQLGEDVGPFSSSMAILAGDLANQLAMLALSQAPFLPADVCKAVACYNQTAVDVCHGQVLDMLLPHTALADVEMQDVWKVMEYKTARYTVEAPLHMGAILVGARETVLRQLSAYAVPLGVAFQLRDDLLNVFGQETQTGKPMASDLIDGKRTLLVVEAWNQASEEQRRRLKSVLGNQAASTEQIHAARGVLEETGAREHALHLAERSAARAKAALETLPIADRERGFLVDLADYVVTRES